MFNEENKQRDMEYQFAMYERIIETLVHVEMLFPYDIFYDLPALFDHLEGYIRQNNEEHFLEDDVKKNIYQIISYFRYEHKYDNEKERIDKIKWCNEMIDLLNQGTYENAVSHYVKEFSMRFNNPGMISRKEYDDLLEKTYQSMVDDVLLLTAVTDSDDFLENSYAYFLEKPFIAYNIDMLVRRYEGAFYAADYNKMLSILDGQRSIMEDMSLETFTIKNKNYSYDYPINQETREALTQNIGVNEITSVMELLQSYKEASLSNEEVKKK